MEQVTEKSNSMNLKQLEKKYPNIVVSGDHLVDSKYLLIDSRVHGLYACFHCVLYGLSICEEEALTPIIYLGDNHLYFEESYGENVFNYFYQQEDIELNGIPKMTVLNMGGYLNWVNISTREKVLSNLLIEKYFKLNEEVRTVIARFCEQFFSNSRMLAVHFRGTDKITETPLLHFTEYLNKIDYLLNNNFFDKIFFATDELSLRDYVKHRYAEKAVLYSIEENTGGKSHLPGTGLHFIPGSSPYLNARNAIIECYLLAQCNALMSSHRSSMSVFVTFVNPDIIHVILEP